MYCNNGPYCEPGEKCCCHKEEVLDLEAESKHASHQKTWEMLKEGVREFALDAILASMAAALIGLLIYSL